MSKLVIPELLTEAKLSETRTVSARIPVELHNRLEALAAEAKADGKTVSITQAVIYGLEILIKNGNAQLHPQRTKTDAPVKIASVQPAATVKRPTV